MNSRERWSAIVFLLLCLSAFVVLATSCMSPKSPLYTVVNSPRYQQENVQPLDPPPHYAVWWKLTEDCLGPRADRYQWGEVEWYTVDEVEADGAVLLGFHMDGSIFLKASEAGEERTVRHEMVHALCSGCYSGPGHAAGAVYKRCTIGKHFMPSHPLFAGR